MQPNPPAEEFTGADFRRGRVPTQTVLDAYKQQPVQHRGPEIVRNEKDFERVVGVPLAENGAFDSTVATLGAALWATTGGKHPVVDFRQPVPFPEGHPRVNFAQVVNAQIKLGFPEQTGELENEEDKPPPSIWEAANQFAAKMLALDSVEEDPPMTRR